MWMGAGWLGACALYVSVGLYRCCRIYLSCTVIFNCRALWSVVVYVHPCTRFYLGGLLSFSSYVWRGFAMLWALYCSCRVDCRVACVAGLLYLYGMFVILSNLVFHFLLSFI